MTVEVSKASWYSKIYSYLKNRNRIEPAKSKLPDCDFFTVGPRRTLRILKPIQRNSEFYDVSTYKSESVSENFISNWIERSNSSNNCRCSFCKSHNSQYSIKRRSIEFNQTGISFVQDEVKTEETGKIKTTALKNVNQFDRSLTSKTKSKVTKEILLRNYLKDNSNTQTSAVKNKVIKNLERYIDIILRNVLDNTINIINSLDITLNNVTCSEQDKPLSDNESTKTLNVKFDFSGDDYNSEYCVTSVDKSELHGYVNQAFTLCVNDPDTLDFYLRKPIDKENLDIIDCIDSGINSVETMEVSIDSDFNVENSITHIIEDKLSHMIVPFDLNNQNNANSTIEPRKNTSYINYVQKENENEISIKKHSASFNIDSINKIDENIYSELTSIVDRQITYETGPIFNVDAHLKTSVKKNCNVKKSLSVATLSANVNSKSDDTYKISDDVKKSQVKVKQELMKSENCNEEKNIEELIQHCRQSLTNLVVFDNIHKPIIVFLHGFGSSAEVFENQLQYFSIMGYLCIAPEMLGHGMSSIPDRKREYHFDRLLSDLEKVLHHYAFKFGRKCVLVAHNYGCSLATALANKYTHEIDQLVLISGGGPMPLASPTKEGACHCCLRIILSPLLMCGFRRDILYATRGRQHPYCGSEKPNQWPFHMKYVLDGMSWPEGDYIFHRKICIPTLLIHGLKDDKVSLVQECQMERTILKANLEAIPRAGHIPMIDTPNQVNHLIHCFINL